MSLKWNGAGEVGEENLSRWDLLKFGCFGINLHPSLLAFVLEQSSINFFVLYLSLFALIFSFGQVSTCEIV